jgi:tetratricopeptide (TPR) repeat protein
LAKNHLALGESDRARIHLEDIVNNPRGLNSEEPFYLLGVAHEKLGELEEAAGLLQQAERKINRARLNGVDDPSIYYSEAVLLAMRSEPASAMEKLREAYNRGFREQWVMEIDGRLAPLCDDPAFIVLMQQIQDDLSQALITIRSLSVAAL